MAKFNFFLDFWSTTCPNCPQAVDVLQQHAKLHDRDDVLFLIINTDNQEKAKPIIQHKNWIFGQHLYMPLAEKEKMKAFLGMKTLPHHVMVSILSVYQCIQSVTDLDRKQWCNSGKWSKFQMA